MRLLRRGILLGVPRPHRHTAELQPRHQLADRALMQLHAELAGDLVAQINEPPANDLMLRQVRALTDPLGNHGFLLGRQFPLRLPPLRPVL